VRRRADRRWVHEVCPRTAAGPDEGHRNPVF
jgi:hypothetical protein